MAATLTLDQLYAALLAPEIEAVTANFPTEDNEPDPVAEEILSALARVDAYATGWAAPAALLTGWARDIAAWHILKRLDIAKENHAKAMDRALKELQDLRDGKFSGVTRATTGRLLYGGKENIL
jgi:hypothetical protein